jgi:hypothetical protein
MTYGCIEDLKFAVEVFDEGGNLKKVLASLHDLDAARAAHQARRANIRNGSSTYARAVGILRRSDQVEPERCDDELAGQLWRIKTRC